jgi:Fic family protein
MPSWDVTFDVQVRTDDLEVVSLAAKCHALASVIREIPITPSRRDRIDRLNILRAVRGTTGIEGAELTEGEVALILDSPNKTVLPPGKEREEQEARNADKLMRYVAQLLRESPDCPLTENLICKFHHLTTHKVNYKHNVPGKYRNLPVSAGDYIPPQEGARVRQLMKEFVSWFNEEEPFHWDPVIAAIVAHFYIVSIHPFGDGNGRTSRAVESFLLYRAGINARGFYSLANYYYQHRGEYLRHLDHIRFETNGDLTPFVLFALRGLAEELLEVHREVLLEVREIAFRDYAREELRSRLATEPGKRMLDFIFLLGNATVSVKAIRHGEHALSRLYHGLTAKTLSRDLNYLKKIELIQLKDGNVRANLDIMGRYLPPHDALNSSTPGAI